MNTQNVQAFTDEARRFFYVRRRKCRTGNVKAEMHPHDRRWRSWTRIGSGFYGEAWAHDLYPGLVIKISGPSGWGYTSTTAVRTYMHCYPTKHGGPREDVWPAYAEHCRDNPHPNLLEVLHLERHGGLVWAVLPRYYPPHDPEVPLIKKFRDTMARGTALSEDDQWMLPLAELAKREHVAVDLHSDNVMKNRITGEIIITDPFSATGASVTGDVRLKDTFTHADTDRTHFTTSSTDTYYGDETC